MTRPAFASAAFHSGTRACSRPSRLQGHNDENLVIVEGHKELGAAYAVHILDVYDHYRFRAIETERARLGKSHWSGFLATKDTWQDGYASRRKGALMRYFAHP